MNTLFKNAGFLVIYEIIALPLWLITRSLDSLSVIAPIFTIVANVVGLPVLFARLNYGLIKKNNDRAWLIFPIVAIMELLAVFLGYFNWGITCNYVNNGYHENHLLNPDGETIMLVYLELFVGVAVGLISAGIFYFFLRKRNGAR